MANHNDVVTACSKLQQQQDPVLRRHRIKAHFLQAFFYSAPKYRSSLQLPCCFWAVQVKYNDANCAAVGNTDIVSKLKELKKYEEAVSYDASKFTHV